MQKQKPHMIKANTLRKIDFRKGNGMGMIGIFVVILAALLCLYLMEFFARNEQTSTLQNAADTIADTTAFSMMVDGGEYRDAVAKALETRQDIERYIGTSIDVLTVDEEEFDHNIVKVTLIQKHIRDPHLFGGAYQVVVDAATKFTPRPTSPDDDEEEETT